MRQGPDGAGFQARGLPMDDATTRAKPAAIARRSVALALCLAAATTGQAASPDRGLQGTFSAPVTVAADGRATIGQIDGIQGALATAVRSQLAAMRFVPARVGDSAVDVRSHLVGGVLLEPRGDGEFDVRLQGVALAPRLVRVQTPRYPPTRLRQGASDLVELLVRVGADGRIEAVRTVASTHRDVEKAVRQVLPRWRFEPMADVEAIEVVVPVWFHAGSADVAPPTFTCARVPGQAYAEDQSGCMDLIEVFGSRW